MNEPPDNNEIQEEIVIEGGLQARPTVSHT
jgi:hypothetical protein